MRDAGGPLSAPSAIPWIRAWKIHSPLESSATPLRHPKMFANDKAERYNRFALRQNFKGGFVYILAGKSGVLYVGVTANLYVRIVQHRQKLIEGFTKKYNISRLVHYEQFGDIRHAIAREKQIKGWLPRKKVALIESTNPTWRDRFSDFSPPHQSKFPSPQ